MAFGIFLDPFMRVDDQKRGLGAGRPADHIFQEFDVTRGIDDDVIAFGGFEKAPGGIDRDSLGLLIFKCV